MKQYCRYCANCAYADFLYCGAKDKFISEKYAKSPNHCKMFELNKIDVFDLGKSYHPRPPKTYQQIKMDFTEDKK